MSIYVLRTDSLVKIGFSEDLRTRVQSIIAAVPVPVEFVGHMPGGKDVEAHLHGLFSEHRFSGEWFVETDEMRSLFASLLIPRLPVVETPKEAKRKVEVADIKAASREVRGATEFLWPAKSMADRVLALAEELGWTRSRAKDLFYGDHRIVLRGFEQKQLENWLKNVEATAFDPAH